jgi:hypothetical protein
MPTFTERIKGFLYPPNLGVVENDNTFYIGTSTASDIFRDRLDYDRLTILSETLRAWRTNPIARWLVQLTNIFVLGNGVEFKTDAVENQKFLNNLYHDDLNNFDAAFPKWLDEQTLSGDLFLLVSVMENGMTYWRAVPSEKIVEIETMPNDYQQ